LGVPKDGVGVEIGRGVEPKVELLLSVAFALAKDVGVEDVRVAAQIPQELKVNLVMGWSLR